MPASTPPPHALPLYEAFTRWTDPDLIAAIGESWLPDRYSPECQPPAFEATARFLERLGQGELIMWAREGSPIGPWVQTPASAWPKLMRVRNWRSGIIGSVTYKAGLVERSGLVTDRNAVPGKVVLRIERRTGPGQVEEWTYWYDARVAPVSEPPARSAGRVSQAVVDEWYKRERVEPFINDPMPPSREDDRRAAKDHFGDRATLAMVDAARNQHQRLAPVGRPPKSA